VVKKGESIQSQIPEIIMNALSQLRVMKDILDIQEQQLSFLKQQVQQTKDSIRRMEGIAALEEEGLLNEVVRQLSLDTETEMETEENEKETKKSKRKESRGTVQREREEKTWTGDLFAM
jgi:DNA-binding protein H-NS